MYTIEWNCLVEQLEFNLSLQRVTCTFDMMGCNSLTYPNKTSFMDLMFVFALRGAYKKNMDVHNQNTSECQKCEAQFCEYFGWDAISKLLPVGKSSRWKSWATLCEEVGFAWALMLTAWCVGAEMRRGKRRRGVENSVPGETNWAHEGENIWNCSFSKQCWSGGFQICELMSNLHVSFQVLVGRRDDVQVHRLSFLWLRATHWISEWLKMTNIWYMSPKFVFMNFLKSLTLSY